MFCRQKKLIQSKTRVSNSFGLSPFFYKRHTQWKILQKTMSRTPPPQRKQMFFADYMHETLYFKAFRDVLPLKTYAVGQCPSVYLGGVGWQGTFALQLEFFAYSGKALLRSPLRTVSKETQLQTKNSNCKLKKTCPPKNLPESGHFILVLECACLMLFQITRKIKIAFVFEVKHNLDSRN